MTHWCLLCFWTRYVSVTFSIFGLVRSGYEVYCWLVKQCFSFSFLYIFHGPHFLKIFFQNHLCPTQTWWEGWGSSLNFFLEVLLWLNIISGVLYLLEPMSLIHSSQVVVLNIVLNLMVVLNNVRPFFSLASLV